MAVGLTAPRSGCSIVGFDKKMITVRGRRSSSVVLQHHRRRGMMMTMALARSNSSGSNHHHHELSPPRKQNECVQLSSNKKATPPPALNSSNALTTFEQVLCGGIAFTAASMLKRELSPGCELIDGKQIAQEIRQEIKEKVERMKTIANGNTPGLAVVLVGERKDSQSYVRSKKKMCAEVGIRSEGTDLPEDATEEEVMDTAIDAYLSDNDHSLSQYCAVESCSGDCNANAFSMEALAAAVVAAGAQGPIGIL